MTPLRKILDWYKYRRDSDRLHHYPALAVFDREAALKRLQIYEREERQACQPWLTFLWILIGFLIALWIVLACFTVTARIFMFMPQIAVSIVQYMLYRRIRRRVGKKVAAELGDGRLWKCLECGYDLRASPDRCPECGAPVRVGPPA